MHPFQPKVRRASGEQGPGLTGKGQVSAGGWVRLKAFMSSCGAFRGSEQNCNTVALDFPSRSHLLNYQHDLMYLLSDHEFSSSPQSQHNHLLN